MAKVTPIKQAEIEMIPYESQSVKPARIRIHVHGVGSLLTHSPEGMGSTPDAKKGSRIPTPEDEAEAGCYRTADGALALKGESFRSSLLGAAGAWKLKRSTARSRVAHIIVVEELVPLVRFDGTPITDYAIDKRRAIVQRQGIIRCRPRFDEWAATFHMEFDPQMINEPMFIVDILADAGTRIGVGDYRPSRNGWFGRYTVHSYGVV